MLNPHVVGGMILYRVLILTHFLLYIVHLHHQFHVLNVNMVCEIMDFVCMVCTLTNVREQFSNSICIVYFSTVFIVFWRLIFIFKKEPKCLTNMDKMDAG